MGPDSTSEQRAETPGTNRADACQVPWKASLAVATLALVSGCGSRSEGNDIAPPREIAAWCDFQGIRLGLEQGVITGGTSCARVASILTEYLGAYESRWQPVGAFTDWTVRVVADRPTQGAQAGKFFAGETFWDSRTIDLYQGSLNVLPHELHHVALGPPSADHLGWCPFGDWEAREGILEEHSYLGCPAD
jgi:hypothetical protein